MWLFGYGSLMWDGWEERFGCLKRMPADLHGHARVFNKKSLERWGTPARPGLTLNLSRSGHCRGVAFEFDDGAMSDIADYLCARETCTATAVAVRLPDAAVGALTYIYEGPRLVEDSLSLEERAGMVLAAAGTAGTSYDYLRGVRAHLAELGVSDPAVEELWRSVTALQAED